MFWNHFKCWLKLCTLNLAMLWQDYEGHLESLCYDYKFQTDLINFHLQPISVQSLWLLWIIKRTNLFTGALFKPKFGYDGVYLLYSGLNLRYLETIKDHKTVIWAANKKSQLENSHKFDIDFILTDDPTTCVETKNEISNTSTNIF